MKYLIKKTFAPFILLFDLIGSILFFWTKMRKMPKPDKIKKVLFIRLEHIGDMVLATPVFETFKKNNPQAKIVVLCRELTVPIIRNNPYVDKIITYEAPWFIKRGGKNKPITKLAKELRSERFDLVFEMHGDPRNNLLAFLSGGYTIGYGCRGGGFFLNRIMPYDPKKHIIDQNLSLSSSFCTRAYNKTRLFTSNEEEKDASNLMKRYSLKNKSFIIISPRSGRTEKDLTDKEVENLISRYRKMTILIVGSRSESESNKSFRRFDNVIDITGKTDLQTLTCLVRRAKKVIAPDTGIIHIAKAAGTDFECVYKTTDVNIWGYKNKR